MSLPQNTENPNGYWRSIKLKEKKAIPIYYVHRRQLLTEEVLELKTVRGLESILEKTTLWPHLIVSNTLYFSLAICFVSHLEPEAWARLSDH